MGPSEFWRTVGYLTTAAYVAARRYAQEQREAEEGASNAPPTHFLVFPTERLIEQRSRNIWKE
jgi:hypothetical protein